jgi:hypothetical protein
MNEKTFECPAADCTCPYYKYGNCSMYPESNPILECDEAAYYSDDCDYEVGYDPYLGCFSDDC